MKKGFKVSRSEYELLKKLARIGIEEADMNELVRELGVNKSTLESLLRLLAEKGVIGIEETEETSYSLTNKGEEALSQGLPEEQLIDLVLSGTSSLEEIRSKLGDIAGIAIGQALKKKYIAIKDGKIVLQVDPDQAKKEIKDLKMILEKISEGIKEVPKDLLKRGLVKKTRIKKERVKILVPLDEVLDNVVVEVSALSRDLIRSGEWRHVALKKYDITALPPREYPARKHYLSEFIEMLRDILKEMGFKEVEGPIIELELFNFDLLFQPQDHPAREIHDTLWIKDGQIREVIPEELLDRVSRIHSTGWRYEWSSDIARRLVLRSQTTAVSARILVSKPNPPLRVFTLGRVYRSDVVDATHLPEFHQLDGLDGDNVYTFRDLLGVLKEISERLGFEIKFKPGYFPFTEPSVEGYVRLPNGKWLELFGAGMMRPEVLEMAGIDYPVGAWGFGVERLAAAYYGLTDIRHLYTKDLRRIQLSRIKL